MLFATVKDTELLLRLPRRMRNAFLREAIATMPTRATVLRTRGRASTRVITVAGPQLGGPRRTYHNFRRRMFEVPNGTVITWYSGNANIDVTNCDILIFSTSLLRCFLTFCGTVTLYNTICFYIRFFIFFTYFLMYCV